MTRTYPISGPGQDSTRILKYLADTDHEKFGFVFYRCCSYDDEARWSAFMARMTEWSMWGLGNEVDGIAIRDRLSLETVEDPILVGASKDEIRRRHREWVNASGEAQNLGMNSRHLHPIYVDQESLDSVLNGPEPGRITSDEMINPTSYVIMIDISFEIPTATEEDFANGFDPADEDCSEIDGCMMEDVGWIKVRPYELMPRAYSIMMGYGWEGSYRRPPRFASLNF